MLTLNKALQRSVLLGLVAIAGPAAAQGTSPRHRARLADQPRQPRAPTDARGRGRARGAARWGACADNAGAPDATRASAAPLTR